MNNEDTNPGVSFLVGSLAKLGIYILYDIKEDQKVKRIYNSSKS